jgi:ABC-type antimicrobial peptide transport system permease subunit
MAEKGNGMGIAALVLGICSIVFSWVFYLGLPCGIVGLVLGLKQKKTNPNKIATAGLILSIIGTVLTVLWIVLFVLLLGTFAMAMGAAATA